MLNNLNIINKKYKVIFSILLGFMIILSLFLLLNLGLFNKIVSPFISSDAKETEIYLMFFNDKGNYFDIKEGNKKHRLFEPKKHTINDSCYVEIIAKDSEKYKIINDYITKKRDDFDLLKEKQTINTDHLQSEVTVKPCLPKIFLALYDAPIIASAKVNNADDLLEWINENQDFNFYKQTKTFTSFFEQLISSLQIKNTDATEKEFKGFFIKNFIENIINANSEIHYTNYSIKRGFVWQFENTEAKLAHSIIGLYIKKYSKIRYKINNTKYYIDEFKLSGQKFYVFDDGKYTFLASDMIALLNTVNTIDEEREVKKISNATISTTIRFEGYLSNQIILALNEQKKLHLNFGIQLTKNKTNLVGGDFNSLNILKNINTEMNANLYSLIPYDMPIILGINLALPNKLDTKIIAEQLSTNNNFFDLSVKNYKQSGIILGINFAISNLSILHDENVSLTDVPFIEVAMIVADSQSTNGHENGMPILEIVNDGLGKKCDKYNSFMFASNYKLLNKLNDVCNKNLDSFNNNNDDMTKNILKNPLALIFQTKYFIAQMYSRGVLGEYLLTEKNNNNNNKKTILNDMTNIFMKDIDLLPIIGYYSTDLSNKKLTSLKEFSAKNIQKLKGDYIYE